MIERAQQIRTPSITQSPSIRGLTLKLNTAIKNEWEKTLSIKTFLESQYKYLNETKNKINISEVKEKKFIERNSSNKQAHFQQGTHLKNYALTAFKSCIFCKGNHLLHGCNAFFKLSPSLWTRKVQELKVCFNCLSTGHGNKECKRGPCKICGRKHNSLHHLDTQDKPQSSVQGPLQISTSVENKLLPPDQQQKIYSTQAVEGVSSYVLLGTALLYLYDHNGKQHKCRAFLNSCSQPHIITTSLCKPLGFHQTKANIILSGIEQGNQQMTFKTTVKLKSRVTNFSTSLTCLVMPPFPIVDNQDQWIF